MAGQIIKIDSNSFILKDFNGKVWTITGSPLIRGMVKMEIGEEIKIIGYIQNKLFVAQEIRPWNGMGQNMMKEN